MPPSNRHDLYLSKTVWGELKLRAFQENQTVGAMIAFLLEWAVGDPHNIPDLSRYQERSEHNEQDRSHRTVRGISDELWERVEAAARQGERPFSISGLVEYLLRDYLGIKAEEDEYAPDPGVHILKDAAQPGALNTGTITFHLGKNPQEIHLGPQPGEARPPKG